VCATAIQSDVKQEQTFEAEAVAEDNFPSLRMTYNITKYE